jgi:hypothetical protein
MDSISGAIKAQPALSPEMAKERRRSPRWDVYPDSEVSMTAPSASGLARCLLALLFLGLMCLACSRSEDGTAVDREPSTDRAGGSTLRDGLYPVLWEAATCDSANLAGSGQVVLPYDRKYSGSAENEPRTYLAIDTSSFVPLILEGQPEALRDETGRALLSVTLAREYVKVLEEFTARHLGEGAAIVLDGEVVTMHKIRSIILEGKLQITRCDTNSCEILRGRLTN